MPRKVLCLPWLSSSHARNEVHVHSLLRCAEVYHKASVLFQTPFGTVLGSLALLSVAMFIRSAKDSRN